MEQAHADLEPEFRAWLLTLGPDADQSVLEVDWHRRASDVVRALADDLLSSLPPAAWKGRMVRGYLLTAAHADARFWRALRAAAPSAFPDRHDGPEAA